MPQEALDQVAAEAEICQRCDLYRHARHAVAGSGAARAEALLVGEAPSYYDEQRGYPFSGPSGVFLDELLALAGLDRTRVFLTNVVKHRTPEGRGPLPAEIAACAPYLARQIEAVNPLVIVALGRAAAARFFPRARITQIHGQARQVNGRVVVAMYNPAAAIHQQALRATVVEDFHGALPAALAEARRLAAAGQLGAAPTEGEPPRQLSLF